MNCLEAMPSSRSFLQRLPVSPPPLRTSSRRWATLTLTLTLALGLAGVLGGCSTAPRFKAEEGLAGLLQASVVEPPGADAASLARVEPGAPRPPHRIAAGDELALAIWGPREIWAEVATQGPQVARTVVVQDDGMVVLPLVRRVSVGGLGLGEALARISDAYRSVAGARFQIDGSITRQRSQTVLVEGSVAKPGLVTLGADLTTLGEAVSGAAGGLLETADVGRGLLVRDGQRYRIDYQAAQQGDNSAHRIALKNGDRVYFPPRVSGVFYVFGEVVVQGTFTIPPQGVTLLQALAQAHGPLIPQADLRSLVLLRPGPHKAQVYRFTLEQAMEAPELRLASGDRLFVPATGVTDWERTIRQALPILSGGLAVTSAASN